jgi:hypothetical protein
LGQERPRRNQFKLPEQPLWGAKWKLWPQARVTELGASGKTASWQMAQTWSEEEPGRREGWPKRRSWRRWESERGEGEASSQEASKCSPYQRRGSSKVGRKEAVAWEAESAGSTHQGRAWG